MRVRTHNSTRNPHLTEICELRGILEKSLRSNREIFDKIGREDSNFCHKLYEPISHEGIGPDFLKALLLKQIDELISEKDHLLKKLEEVKFKHGDDQLRKEADIKKNSYIILRQAWTRLPKGEVNCMQRIDNLNKVIAMIGKDIKSGLSQEATSGLDFKGLEEKRPSKMQECKLEELEMLLMKNEDLRSRFAESDQIIRKQARQIQNLENQIKALNYTINKGLHTFNENASRIKDVEEVNSQLLRVVQSLQAEPTVQSQTLHTKIYTSHNSQFKLTLESQILEGVSYSDTNRTLEEILLFFNPEKYDKSCLMKVPQTRPSNPEDGQMPIPPLDLMCHTRNSGLTERINSKNDRFLPLRTCRPKLKTSQRFINKNQNIDNGKQLSQSSRGSRKISRKRSEFIDREEPIPDLSAEIQTIRNKLAMKSKQYLFKH